jgi:hypothetical protein
VLINTAKDKNLSFSDKEIQEKLQSGFPNHFGIKQILLNASLGFIECRQK